MPFTLLEHEQLSYGLELIAPSLHIRLTSEIRNAKETHKSPKDVWPSLYAAIPETYALGQQYLLNMLFDFFMTAESSETPFFVSVLREYVEEFKKQRKTGSTSQSAVGTNPDATMPSLTDEVGQRLKLLSLQVEYRSARRPYVERLCKVTAILVSEGVILFDDIWPYMGDDTSLDDIEITCRKQVAKALQDLQDGRSLKKEDGLFNKIPLSPNSNAENHMYKTFYETFEAVFRSGEEFPCPLKVWFLAALSGEGAAYCAMPHFDPYKTLMDIGLYLPVRASLFSGLLSQFHKTTREHRLGFLRHAGKILGLHVGQDFCFFRRACNRCASKYVSNQNLVLDVVRETILPGLSFYIDNGAATDSVWSIFVQMDVQTRYYLFAQWRTFYVQVLPYIVVNFVTGHDVKILLQRLTKNSVRSVGKSIALRANTNPLVVWYEILHYIFQDASRISVVVDLTASYTKPLAQDVLFFVIIDKMRAMQDEEKFLCDASLELRYRSLSIFAASLFQKCKYLQGHPLAEYLEFLAKGDFTCVYNLVFLSDLLKGMSGIGPVFEPSDAESRALGGSFLLRREVLLPTTVDMAESLAFVKKEVSQYCDDSYWGQMNHSVIDRSTFGALETPVMQLIAALRYNSLGQRIIASLTCRRTMRLHPELRITAAFSASDWNAALLDQVLNILKLCQKDALDILPEASTLHDRFVPFSILMVIHRVILRSKIETHTLDFVRDVKSLRHFRKSQYDNFYAFFWAPEAYDIYVPDSEYAREALRIASLNSGLMNSAAFDASRSHLINLLNTSREEHAAHVTWILSRLPKLMLSDPDFGLFLRYMVIPRMMASTAGAHYVLCFLALTFADPVPLLDALFDVNILVEILSCLSSPSFLSAARRAFAYALNEIWRDAIFSISLKHMEHRSVALRVHNSGSCPDQGEQSEDDIKKSTFHQNCPETLRNEVEKVHAYEDREYSLFVNCNDIELHLDRWEETIFSVVSFAHETGAVALLETTLSLLIHVAPVVPRSYTICRAFMDNQLAKTRSNKENSKAASLAEQLDRIYAKRRANWDGYDSERQSDETFESKGSGSSGPTSLGDIPETTSLKRSGEQLENTAKQQRVFHERAEE